MDKKILCPHCEKTHVRKEIDPPKEFIVNMCRYGNCPFYHTEPVDSCAITCEQLDGKGEFPVNCPVNKKILRVRTAEVNY